MITSPTAYWQTVLQCLTHLGKVSATRAHELLGEYRLRLQSMPEGLRPDIVFHHEPWQLALRLTGVADEALRDRRLSEDEQRWYEKTMEKAIADAAVIGNEMEVGMAPVVSEVKKAGAAMAPATAAALARGRLSQAALASSVLTGLPFSAGAVIGAFIAGPTGAYLGAVAKAGAWRLAANVEEGIGTGSPSSSVSEAATKT